MGVPGFIRGVERVGKTIDIQEKSKRAKVGVDVSHFLVNIAMRNNNVSKLGYWGAAVADRVGEAQLRDSNFRVEKDIATRFATPQIASIAKEIVMETWRAICGFFGNATTVLIVFDGVDHITKEPEHSKRLDAYLSAVRSINNDQPTGAGLLKQCGIVVPFSLRLLRPYMFSLLSEIVCNDRELPPHARAAHPDSVQVLRAPFEAEFQLAYMHKKGLIDFTSSEDTDLLVLGVPTVFKMSGSWNSHCMFVDGFEYLGKKHAPKETKKTSTELDLSLITSGAKSVFAACMIGCDFSSVAGFGVGKVASTGKGPFVELFSCEGECFLFDDGLETYTAWRKTKTKERLCCEVVYAKAVQGHCVLQNAKHANSANKSLHLRAHPGNRARFVSFFSRK